MVQIIFVKYKYICTNCLLKISGTDCEAQLEIFTTNFKNPYKILLSLRRALKRKTIPISTPYPFLFTSSSRKLLESPNMHQMRSCASKKVAQQMYRSRNLCICIIYELGRREREVWLSDASNFSRRVRRPF
jgi:hypothetical protein